MNLAILDSAILEFPLKLTLAKIGFNHFAHKKTSIHSFWLNLMMSAILNSAILDSAILTQNSKLHSFILYSTWWWQPSWILPSWIQPFWTFNSFILTQLDNVSHLEFYHFGFSHFAQNKLYSFILTQLDDGSHLEFCHLGFSHCHFGFRHLVIFSQIHSKTLSHHSDSD